MINKGVTVRNKKMSMRKIILTPVFIFRSVAHYTCFTSEIVK